MGVDVTQLLVVLLFFSFFLSSCVSQGMGQHPTAPPQTPPFTAEIKTWILINTPDLFLCGVGVMRGEQEEEDIQGGVSDERQLEIRRKRKKIQEKLSDGEKNVTS